MITRMSPSTTAVGCWSAVMATVFTITYSIARTLVLMVGIHQRCPSPDRKIWSHAAIACATVYALLVSLTYSVQLTWVGPRLADGQTRGIEPFVVLPLFSPVFG